MRIHKIETGNFMLDGGATFGVVPKSLWSKAYRANEMNLCNLSLRCLLVETDNRKIVIDTGIGDKQDENFLKYYYLNGHGNLETSVKNAGLKMDDITDVLITHLHFDHVGGALQVGEQGDIVPTFPKAKHWVSRQQWQWANKPNQREKPSFIKDNIEPLHKLGLLHFIDEDCELFPNIEVRLYHGHTAGLAIPFIHNGDQTIVFTGDLLPTSAHLPMSWICGYDTRPLVSLEEKALFLREVCDKKYILFFEHDLYTECCTVKDTDKGIRVDRRFSLQEALNMVTANTQSID